MHDPTYRIAHTTAFVTPVMDHWLEREIVQWAAYESPFNNIYVSVNTIDPSWGESFELFLVPASAPRLV